MIDGTYSEGRVSTDNRLLAVRAKAGEPALDMTGPFGFKVYTGRRRHGKRSWNRQKGQRGIYISEIGIIIR